MKQPPNKTKRKHKEANRLKKSLTSVSLNQQDAYVPQGQLAFSIDTENSEKQN